MTGETNVSRRLLTVLTAAVALGAFATQRSLTGENGSGDVGFDAPSSLPWSGTSTMVEPVPVPWQAPDALRNPFLPTSPLLPRPEDAAQPSEGAISGPTDDLAEAGTNP